MKKNTILLALLSFFLVGCHSTEFKYEDYYQYYDRLLTVDDYQLGSIMIEQLPIDETDLGGTIIHYAYGNEGESFGINMRNSVEMTSYTYYSETDELIKRTIQQPNLTMDEETLDLSKEAFENTYIHFEYFRLAIDWNRVTSFETEERSVGGRSENYNIFFNVFFQDDYQLTIEIFDEVFEVNVDDLYFMFYMREERGLIAPDRFVFSGTMDDKPVRIEVILIEYGLDSP